MRQLGTPAALLTLLVAACTILAGGAAGALDDPPQPLAGYSSVQDAAGAARALAGWRASSRRSWWRRTYSSRYDERRYYARWEGNLNRTIAWNLKPGISYWRGLTDQFSLMNFTEIQQQYLMKGIDPGVLRSGRSVAKAAALDPPGGRRLVQALPTEVDLRTARWGDIVPPVRPSQGKCGSCWAQAALAAMESRALKDRVDKGPNLSERQMLDCVNVNNGFRSRGCNGGLAEEALEYASRQFAATQPAYAQAPGSGCKTRFTSTAGGISLAAPGYRAVDSSAQAIMRALITDGPVLVYFQVDESFVFYDSGIYPASACKAAAGGKTYNHAVLIVGFSQAADPLPYWIVRNSWGESWGIGGIANLGGYARVQMTFDMVGACGMYRYPIVPLRTRKAGRLAPPPRRPPPAKSAPCAAQLATGIPQLPKGYQATCSGTNVQFRVLTSGNGQFTLAIRPNRDIVLTKQGSSRPLWSAGTGIGSSPDTLEPYFELQTSGALAVYEFGASTPFWSTGTAGRSPDSPFSLVLTNRGNLLLSDGRGRPMWQTGTGQNEPQFYDNVRWVDVTSSSDGKVLTAAFRDGPWLYSRDGGESWEHDGSVRAWAALASAGDGSVSFAAESNGYVYVASNSFLKVVSMGQLGQRRWVSLAVSTTGDRLVAAAAGSPLWSAAIDLGDRNLPGVTATQLTAAGRRDWSAVALSGSLILAAANGDYLYLSIDGGGTFQQLTGVDSRAAWAGVAIAVSGGVTFQFAAVRNGDILCTTNNWASFFKWTYLGVKNWTSIAVASTGYRSVTMAAPVDGRGLVSAQFYMGQDGKLAVNFTSVFESLAAGRQAWARISLSKGGTTRTAVARDGLIWQSMDSGRTWAPPFRGVRLRQYDGVQSSCCFPDFDQLTLVGDSRLQIIKSFDGSFTANQFSGSLLVPRSGRYVLHLRSNNRARLWLDDYLLIDQVETIKSQAVYLSAGWIPFRLETFTGGEFLEMEPQWEGPGIAKQGIDSKYLSHAVM
ncbi:hypothetical protein ABPG77_011005 [Micractinium sp. CCAP 211/92]